MHACVHRILTRAVMGGIGKVPWPYERSLRAELWRREDAVLKFCSWVPGIAAGWAGVSMDR